MARKKKMFKLERELRAIARERLGSPPAVKPIEPKTLRKKPKHKKPLDAEAE